MISYAFLEHDGDDGIIPDLNEKVYLNDWGVKIPVVKATAGNLTFLSDNEMAALFRGIGATVISVDGRPADSSGALLDAGATNTRQLPKATYKRKRFDPRKVRFTFENNATLSVVIPNRLKLKAIIDHILDSTRSKAVVVGMELIGEKFLDATTELLRLFNIQPKDPKSVKRWHSAQSNDLDRKNSYFTYPFRYWADIGLDGKQNSPIASVWRVKVQGDADGKIGKPDAITQATIDRLMKKINDRGAILRQKYCAEARAIEERKVRVTFNIQDDSEGLAVPREMESQIDMPISWHDGRSDIGNDGIRNALNQLLKNQDGVICLDYFGESNKELAQWYEPTLLQRIV